MLKKTLLLLAIAVAAIIPSTASAQQDGPNGNDDDEGFLLRINGDVTIAREEIVSAVMVIRGDIVVSGTIEDALIVINGDARIANGGRVDGDVNIIRGDLMLESGSTVENVNLYNSDLQRAQGATVTGDINEEDDFRWGWGWGGAIFGIWLWLSLTVALLLAGLIFAAIGGLQLQRAAYALTEDVAFSILGAVIVWIGGPLLAVIAFVTIVGIPFALGVLLVALPALWFLGYIVSATRLGLAIARRWRGEPGAHPYLAVFLGVLILQVIVLIPVLGWIIAILAGVYGAGGLALVAWRAMRRGPGEPRRAEPAPEPA